MSKPSPHHKSVLSLASYVPGKSSIADVKDPIKLSSNENPFGASPKAIEALENSNNIHRYPDGSHQILRSAIGDAYELDADQIICGVGSDELLNLIADIYAGTGDEVIHTKHGFLMYPIAAARVGATPISVDETNLKTDVDNILNAVNENTKIVYIANPNNPTGSYLNKAELQKLHSGLPENVVLVIDNAYAEYVTADDYSFGYSLAQNYENVIITHTFSKIYGLGGVRIGWAYSNPTTIDYLNRIRSPFNLSKPALDAALAAISDQEFILKSRNHNTTWRAKLKTELESLGFTIHPSECNFLLVECASTDEAHALNEHLLSNGIIIRQMHSYKLPSCVRITIGTEDENTQLIKAINTFKS